MASSTASAVLGSLYASPFFNGALCADRDHNPEWWTSDPRSVGITAHRANQHRAIAICMQCPLMVKCAMHAVNSPELEGVWGATTDDTRKKLRKKPRR